MNEVESLESPKSFPKSRRFPDEFKRDAVRLVTDEQYTFEAAAQAVSVKSLYDWHKKFAPPPEQRTGTGFIIPAMVRGRKPKGRKKATDLRAIRKKRTAITDTR